MRKIFLTAMAVLSIASAQVFGMYGVTSDWIDFLTHGNQFRARLQQLGFTLGNDTIKGTFGFHTGNGGTHGLLFNTEGGSDNIVQTGNWSPDISMGIGYTSSLISVGVGYNITIGKIWRGVNGKAQQQTAHTPVLVLNAMDNAFRMAFPIQVFSTKNIAQANNNSLNGDASSTNSVTAVSIDPQFRYYTGLDFLPQIRLLLYYGHYNKETKDSAKTQKTKLESFGFQFRLYFGSMVEEVALQPIIRIAYKTALSKHGNTDIKATKIAREGYSIYTTVSEATPSSDLVPAYELLIRPSLGLTANSDIVSLYLEPYLGYQLNKNVYKSHKVQHNLAYGAYAEIYLRPIQSVEWYFEADAGNLWDDGSGNAIKGLSFAASTGVTWYLPQL